MTLLLYQTKQCLSVKDDAEGSKDGNNSNAEGQEKCGLKSKSGTRRESIQEPKMVMIFGE